MPKERNKADDYREKAYAGDTKAMNNLGVCSKVFPIYKGFKGGAVNHL
jgi:hypothetical protein